MAEEYFTQVTAFITQISVSFLLHQLLDFSSPSSKLGCRIIESTFERVFFVCLFVFDVAVF